MSGKLLLAPVKERPGNDLDQHVARSWEENLQAAGFDVVRYRYLGIYHLLEGHIAANGLVIPRHIFNLGHGAVVGSDIKYALYQSLYSSLPVFSEIPIAEHLELSDQEDLIGIAARVQEIVVGQNTELIKERLRG